MIEINKIRNNKVEVIKLLLVKNFKDAEIIINNVLELDQQRKDAQKSLDNLRTDLKNKTNDIHKFISNGDSQIEDIKKEVSILKTKIKDIETKSSDINTELNNLLLTIPNIPHISVPFGRSSNDNEIIYQKGEIPSLYDEAIPHWDICSKYDIVDFELGVKITGAGFPVYKNKGAKLQRALINFFLDEASQAGFEEVQIPLMVNEESALGTGQLPDKEGQMYHITKDKLYMIPTAEVPITNIFRDVIIKEKDFPIKKCGYSQCFRRESGSYGKDVRGLNRLHQFDKVEIVCIEHPDKSYEQLDKMKEHVSNLLDKLELPYRVLKLCGGDMSFTSALTFDFEVYSAAQQRWLEVSSVSNFETYQSNRLKLRFKNSNGKSELVHTLNGSALALPRILAALLENNQTEEGIRIPKALIPYTKFDLIN